MYIINCSCYSRATGVASASCTDTRKSRETAAAGRILKTYSNTSRRISDEISVKITFKICVGVPSYIILKVVFKTVYSVRSGATILSRRTKYEHQERKRIYTYRYIFAEMFVEAATRGKLHGYAASAMRSSRRLISHLTCGRGVLDPGFVNNALNTKRNKSVVLSCITFSFNDSFGIRVWRNNNSTARNTQIPYNRWRINTSSKKYSLH